MPHVAEHAKHERGGQDRRAVQSGHTPGPVGQPLFEAATVRELLLAAPLLGVLTGAVEPRQLVVRHQVEDLEVTTGDPLVPLTHAAT